MDELVRQALAKWPNVPDCFGWLALDRRGQWRLGHERQTITNPSIGAFIARNYICDEEGRWLFQNGPQRVFVDLDYTPWIWRTVPEGDTIILSNHAGERVGAPDAVWLDEHGRVLFKATRGPIGVLHDHDTEQVIDWIEDDSGAAPDPLDLEEWPSSMKTGQPTGLRLVWPLSDSPLQVQAISSAEVEGNFGFIAHPASEER